MKLIKASKLPLELVNVFLESNQQINKEHVLQSGYIIEVNHKICGCFVLEHIEKGLYVLQQFFVTTTDAMKIPVLVESILLLAKQKGASEIFVHSHKLMIDMILEALQFHPQECCGFLDKYTKNEGKWWSYAISG